MVVLQQIRVPTAFVLALSSLIVFVLHHAGVYSTEEWAHVPELGLKCVHKSLILICVLSFMTNLTTTSCVRLNSSFLTQRKR